MTTKTTAYQDGYNDRIMGVQADTGNPFCVSLPEHIEWLKGWLAADADIRRIEAE